MLLSRRRFVLSSATAASALLTGCASWSSGNSKKPPERLGGTVRNLIVDTRSIEVNGRAATVYGLHQPGGTRGLFLDPGEQFSVQLANSLSEPTIVHWHGQTPPSAQDGVSLFGVPPLIPGERRSYDFVPRAGTHWMHSHQGFQHQKMLSGPLIVRTADEVSADNQEVTIFLEDFLFRDPLDVMSALEKGGAEPMGKKGDAGMPADKMDLNDVDFDAYLANDRTLDDPQVIRVEKGGRVRLRVINGASSTNFQIDLGSLRGTVVAVDGNATQPLAGSRFGLAMAQRIDILVDLPSGAGVWPILAVREGDKRQTGVVLASPGINVRKVAALATTTAGAVDLDQEQLLSAREPLSLRPADLHVLLTLTGSMHPYAWGINHKGWDDRDTVKVSSGQRVWITFQNTTKMSHPMHLHGHHFQVVALNGKTISGAVRDTILVPPMANVTVAFDANNPGNWLLHCHNQYHMEAGMITDVSYV